MTKAYLLEDKSTELSLVNIEMGIQRGEALCPGCTWDKGYLLTATPPDVERGVALLGCRP